MAVDQARHRERHVQRMAHVVVERVAGEVARIVALEQGLEVGEGARERRQVDAGIAGGVQRHHRVADPRRILDVDPVGHVVLVETVLHCQSRRKRAARLPAFMRTINLTRWSGKQGEPAGKPGSVARPVRPGGTGSHSSRPRVTPGLKPPTRKLGRAGHMACCHAALAYLVLLRMEVAAFHPRLLAAGTRLCGPLRHVAVPGRYPASRSAEPGLSSALACSGCLADSRRHFTALGGSTACRRRSARPARPSRDSRTPAAARGRAATRPAQRPSQSRPAASRFRAGPRR